MKQRHLVQQADQLLREWIKSSGLPPGSRIPSERALSKELNLPYYGVNRAMAFLMAEGLVTRQGYKLTLALPAREESSFLCNAVIARRSVFLPSYRKAARDLGVKLTMHLWDSTEEAVSILERLNKPQTPGVIFAPPSEYFAAGWDEALRRLVANGIPTVCVGQPATGVNSIIGDDPHALETIFDHLLELGHSQMALAALTPWNFSSTSILAQWQLLCQRRHLASSQERLLRITALKLMPEDNLMLVRRLLGEWKDVTALVIYSDNEFPVQHLLDELGRRKVKVPANLSMIVVGDYKSLQAALPPISATAIDMSLFHETAFNLVRRGQRKKEEISIVPKPCTLRLQHDLVLRGSTGPAPGAKPRALGEAAATKAPPAIQPLADPGAAVDIETAWRRAYDLAARASEDRFTLLDLTKEVNRPLNFRRGWLGDLPLQHFPPGRHVIHGVPFQVLGGNRRQDGGAVIFQSQVNTTGNAKKLPSCLRLNIDAKVSAIYVLHGCGYTKYMHRFASYAFFNGKEKLGEVPVVSLGKPNPDTSSQEMEKAVAACNIQDWWPDYPHYEFPHARIVPMLEGGKSESIHRHVYLYTLEWINPSPKTTVTHLEITSDAEQSTTLGVLAVSVLRR